MKSYNELTLNEQKALDNCDYHIYKVISSYTDYITDYSILSKSELQLSNYINGYVILTSEFKESLEHLTEQMPLYSTISDHDKISLKLCAFTMHHILFDNHAIQDHSLLNESYEYLFKYIEG